MSTWNHAIRVLAPLTLLAACAEVGSVCDDPSDPSSCGCAITCAAGEWCIDGQCRGGLDPDNCGPEGVVCDLGEQCLPEVGECYCDADLNADDPAACGCPAVDCSLLDDAEMCVDGECVCDPEYHKENDGACGCPPVACDEGDVCQNGECVCVPTEHLTDSDDCACKGPCVEGEVCRSGRCVCPSGTIECGGECVPLGYRCCDDAAGVACAADQACELDLDAKWVCRPGDVTPCYFHDRYAGFCARDEVCERAPGDAVACRPRSKVGCYQDDVLMHVCEHDEVCERTADGFTCRREGASACYDGEVLVGACRGSDEVCEKTADGFHCRHRDERACRDGEGLLLGTCQSTDTCIPGGACLPAGRKLCGDGVTTCESDDFCEWGALGSDCRPQGTVACYDAEDAYLGACQQGQTCELVGDGFFCRPANTVPCYLRNGAFDTFCESGESCEETREGHACREPGQVACYGDDGFLARLCGQGFSCSPDSRRCVARNHHYCPDDRTVCGDDEVCERSRGGYACRPRQTIPCYRAGHYDGFCEQGWTCAESRDESRCVPPRHTPCFRGGALVGTCAAGLTCLENGDCMPGNANICSDRRSWCDAARVCYRGQNGANFCVRNRDDPCLDGNGRLIVRDGAGLSCAGGLYCDESDLSCKRP